MKVPSDENVLCETMSELLTLKIISSNVSEIRENLPLTQRSMFLEIWMQKQRITNSARHCLETICVQNRLAYLLDKKVFKKKDEKTCICSVLKCVFQSK